jgi:hypothetical protein
MTATTCFMEFIFLTGREKPIDESDVDNDGEIDSESTGIGNSINNKVWGHLKDRWATIKVFFFFFFIVSQRSSRCPYTLLLIEFPIPVVSRVKMNLLEMLTNLLK